METPQFIIEDMEVHLGGNVFRIEATPIYRGEGDEKVLQYAARVFTGDHIVNRESITFHETADAAITAGFEWLKREG